MRVLFITPYVPTPIRVRPYSLLNTLVERGHKVTLATLWSTEAEQAHLAALEQKGVQILAEPLSPLQSLRNCLGALPTSTPLQAVYCWQPGLIQALDQLHKAETFDVIHVEHLRGVHYGLALKHWEIPIVWDSVDCISHLFEQAVTYSRSLFGQWITRLELGRTRRYEAWLLTQFRTVLVTSAVDQQALLQLVADDKQQFKTNDLHKVQVLPNGVDLTYFSPNGSKPEAETLVFSGKMSYHANVTMALHLIQNIMPYVWAERPGAKVVIVGQSPPSKVQNLGRDPRVTVTGYVPDIRPYLRQATVAVAPSAYGAGIQNKVLEAMACGTPVVATERAIMALKLQPEHDILVANAAEAFAQQVLRLLAEPTLRETIGHNGYNYVKQCHNWFQIGADLETIYQTAIADQTEVK